MKIYKNIENCKKAWMLVAAALNTISELFIDNNDIDEETSDAFYLLMDKCNNWYDKIKEMPF